MTVGVREKVFNAKRDSELIAAGTHFWCQSCLVAKPLSKKSPDPRYCQSCYAFLLREAETQGIRAGWVPKSKKKATKESPAPLGSKAKQAIPPSSIETTTPPAPTNRQKGVDIIPTPAPTTLTPPKRIVSTMKAKKDKTPSGGKKRAAKRGPKFKPLPEGLIMRWAKKEDMGSKAIATRLAKERGIDVSYKTIQRLLAGQRQLSLST